MNNIKNIIFDFGGVIYKINEDLATKRFRELSKYPDLFINKIKKFHKNKIFIDFQNGVINSSEFRQKCKEEFDLEIDDFDFDYAWNRTLIELPLISEEMINKIKDKYKIILLSNTNEIHYNHFKNECKSVFKKFDSVFFSHLLHLSKPDTEVYKYVLKKMNFKAGKTLFIDDSQENLTAAKKLGIKTILVEKNNFNQVKNIFQNGI